MIIAGGSGTRLWPLSTKEYPKHLLRLTNDRSLLQNTYDRVKGLSEDIFVITEKSHSKFVRQQLPDIPGNRILAEPGRRGTASCFILALSEIRRHRMQEQSIFFLWADHLVNNAEAFQQTARKADELAKNTKKLVFTGVKPTYPSTGFGYIQKEKSTKMPNGVYGLKQFVEKPSIATAKRYVKSGQFLWNTGYLTGTINSFEEAIRQHAPRLWNDYQILSRARLPMTRKKIYKEFISEPIDTALSEHIPDGLVVEGRFDWADVGSFSDLHGVSEQDVWGNYTKGKDIELHKVTNSYVRNETKQPVAIIGVDNVAVISTKHGILVTSKDQAQQVGDIAKKLQKERKGFKWLEKL